MSVDKDTVKRIARLARIRVTEEQLEVDGADLTHGPEETDAGHASPSPENGRAPPW